MSQQTLQQIPKETTAPETFFSRVRRIAADAVSKKGEIDRAGFKEEADKNALEIYDLAREKILAEVKKSNSRSPVTLTDIGTVAYERRVLAAIQSFESLALNNWRGTTRAVGLYTKSYTTPEDMTLAKKLIGYCDGSVEQKGSKLTIKAGDYDAFMAAQGKQTGVVYT